MKVHQIDVPTSLENIDKQQLMYPYAKPFSEIELVTQTSNPKPIIETALIRQDRKHQRRRSRAFLVASWTIRIIALMWVLVFIGALSASSSFNELGLIVLGLVFVGWYILDRVADSLLTLSERKKRPTVAERMREDPRKPILFLRSFGDEETRFVGRERFAQRRVSDILSPELIFWRRVIEAGLSRRRVEEVVIATLERCGPPIAIGKPGDAIPPAGASREQVPAAIWQNVVTQRMGEAALIVILAGHTDGLKWELSEVIRSGHLNKLLIVMPPTVNTQEEDDEQARWSAVSLCLEPVGWPKAVEHFGKQGIIALHRLHDGSIVVLKSAKHTTVAYETAMTLASYAMLHPH
jgi:hypothetical protein